MPSGKLDDRRSPGPIIAMHCSPEGSEPIFTFTFTGGSESIFTFTFTEGREPIFTFKRLLQPATSKPCAVDFLAKMVKGVKLQTKKGVKPTKLGLFFVREKF